MDEEKNYPDELAEEFRALGRNMVDTMKKFWQSEERAHLQEEIEKGLADFTDSVREEVQKFNESPSGQQLKLDLEVLHERIRSGEVQDSVRHEILEILRNINQELGKVSNSQRTENPPTE